MIRPLQRKFLFSKQKSILLTGIQPTGNLHIGNYLGSIANMLKLQHQTQFKEMYLMIADYHSLTTAFTYEHSNISYNSMIGNYSLQMAKTLLACGVDPQKMCMFVQSQVPQHTELTWIFSCIAPQHWLNTMIQYKEKSHQNSSIGLYTYPILMAVDILLYKASHVPVGIDQLQHIQLTNKIGQRFNKQFKTTFFPKVKYVKADYPKVMSLTDPTKKMSKSQSNDRSRINLSDKPNEIREKIRRAVTDSEGHSITYDSEKRPGLCNLLTLYSSFTHKQIEKIVQEYQKQGKGIPQLKKQLQDIMCHTLGKFQQNFEIWKDDDVKQVLRKGAKQASQAASKNLTQVKEILKLYQ